MIDRPELLLVRDAFGGRKCFRKYFRRCFRKSEVTKCIFYPAYLVQNSEGRFRGAGSASGGASGSRKSPKCIFVQRIWYRIVRDAFGGRKCFRKYFRKCFRKSEVARKYKRASRTLSEDWSPTRAQLWNLFLTK